MSNSPAARGRARGISPPQPSTALARLRGPQAGGNFLDAAQPAFVQAVSKSSDVFT